MAEGMASGADEALVFDSLAERNRSGEWPKVLDHVMRWQGVGMVIAMLVGGAVYDPAFVGRAAAGLGFDFHPTQGTTLRFPIYLNLVTALVTLVTAIGMREPAVIKTKVAPEAGVVAGAESTGAASRAQGGPVDPPDARRAVCDRGGILHGQCHAALHDVFQFLFPADRGAAGGVRRHWRDAGRNRAARLADRAAARGDAIAAAQLRAYRAGRSCGTGWGRVPLDLLGRHFHVPRSRRR